MTNPTLLIIPGSFMPSSMFQPLITQLKAHHIPAVTHDLRSTIAADPTIPTPDMYTDAAFFHSRALDLLNQGKDIMLFAHSYGGMVASEMMKGLPTRRTEGKGRVVGIIYQSAMVIPVGKCLLDGMGDGLPPILDVEGDYMRMQIPPGAALAFSDMPTPLAEAAARQMTHHAIPSYRSKLTYPGYWDVPVAYIKTTQDKILDLAGQDVKIEVAKKGGEREVDVYEIESGHSPNVSCVGVLAERVKAAVGRLVERSEAGGRTLS